MLALGHYAGLLAEFSLDCIVLAKYRSDWLCSLCRARASLQNAGIKASDAALAAFELVKTKKRDFVIFKINDAKTEVVVEQVFPADNAEDDLKALKNDIDEKKRESNFASRVSPKFVSALTAVTNSARFAGAHSRSLVCDCHLLITRVVRSSRLQICRRGACSGQDPVLLLVSATVCQFLVFMTIVLRSLSRCPEKTGVREKMMAASTNQTFSAKLNIVAKVRPKFERFAQQWC